jgi:hypothetical protein
VSGPAGDSYNSSARPGRMLEMGVLYSVALGSPAGTAAGTGVRSLQAEGNE